MYWMYVVGTAANYVVTSDTEVHTCYSGNGPCLYVRFF